MKCHYIYDKVAGKIHIPYCWSAVLHGPGYCTCRDTPETFEEFEKQQYNDTVKELKKEIRDLEQYNAQLNRIIKKLLSHGKQLGSL